jgi:hypothetical protein
MFLVVFVTLVISVIGLFTQVVALQSAQIYNAQSGLSQLMEIWHGVAVNMNFYTPATNAGLTSGCRLTYLGNIYSTVPVCTATGGGLMYVSTTPATGYVPLPSGYNTTFSFLSVAYQTPAPVLSYVVTYVNPAAADASGFLILPQEGGKSIGYKAADLIRQLKRDTSNIVYGTVTSPGILTVAPNNTVQKTLTYPIPASVPTGSIALVSAAN